MFGIEELFIKESNVKVTLKVCSWQFRVKAFQMAFYLSPFKQMINIEVWRIKPVEPVLTTNYSSQLSNLVIVENKKIWRKWFKLNGTALSLCSKQVFSSRYYLGKTIWTTSSSLSLLYGFFFSLSSYECHYYLKRM